MFEIEMLPAREGDCLWVRWGSKTAPKQMLIDAGRAATFQKDLRARLSALPPKQRTFEAFVITHVDRDHIEGAVGLLEDKSIAAKFKEIWFNGYDHLQGKGLESLGAVQGERVTAALLARLKDWNRKWKGRPIELGAKSLPTKKLAGGMTLTLLSPDRRKLLALIPQWEKECEDAGIIAGKGASPTAPPGVEEFGAIDVETLASTPFAPDVTKPNGSSIAFLLQYGKRKAILAADAHVDRLVESVKALGKGKRLKVDLLKVSHHGSEGNIAREFLDCIECPVYLISTSGAYFKHPKASAIARILKFGGATKSLHFNYRSDYTKVWDSERLKAKYGYTTVYPDKTSNGTLTVAL